MKCIVLFTSTLCVLQAPSVKRPQVIGSNKEGVYILCSRCLRNTNRVNKCSVYCCHCSSSNNDLSFNSRKCPSVVTDFCHENECKKFIVDVVHNPLDVFHNHLVCTSTVSNNDNVSLIIILVRSQRTV